MSKPIPELRFATRDGLMAIRRHSTTKRPGRAARKRRVLLARAAANAAAVERILNPKVETRHAR
jgi:hypothetical protein